MQEHWLISHKNKNPLTEKEKWVSGATSGIREREERKKWKRKSEINTVLAPSNRVELPSWLAAKIYGKCLLQFLLTSPGASLVDHMVKNLSAMQETQVPSLGQADPLEKEMATYSNILAWRTPWTEEPGLKSMVSQRIRHDWATHTFTLTSPDNSADTWFISNKGSPACVPSFRLWVPRKTKKKCMSGADGWWLIRPTQPLLLPRNKRPPPLSYLLICKTLTKDKTLSEASSVSKGPKPTDHVSVPEVDAGDILENMTSSLSSKAPRQERQIAAETGTSLLFDKLRDVREKQEMQGLQRRWNLPQQGGVQRHYSEGGHAGPDMLSSDGSTFNCQLFSCRGP